MSDPQELQRRMHERQRALMERLAPARSRYLHRLQEAVYPGYRFPWRVAECPALIPAELFERDLAAVRSLLTPFFGAGFRERHLDYVPERYRRRDGKGWFPRFLATDFQRVWSEASRSYTWCFPEVQSFPANLLLKELMIHSFAEELPEWSEAELQIDPGFEDHEGFRRILRDRVFGSLDPARCPIVDLDPLAQKTVVDMLLFTKHYGTPLVSLEDLEVDDAGRVSYRRSTVYRDGHPHSEDHEARPAEGILCRALPDEIDLAVETGRLDPGLPERLFLETTEKGGVEWIVHPQDFFVLSKASLVDNPLQHPRLRPVTEALPEELEREGLAFADGIIKPAHAAGGRGIQGFSGRIDDGVAQTLGRRLEAARASTPRIGDHLEALQLWQERYGCDPFDVPGDSEARVYHELRLLWTTATNAEGAVDLRLHCGLTRWSTPGVPANAGRQKTAFTGTQGILVDRRPDPSPH